MKKTELSIAKIILSVAMLPMWFVKMFEAVGHLPNQDTGEITEVIFRHSMFENICDGFHPILAYISIAVIILSVVLNTVAFKCPTQKKLQAVGNIVFWLMFGLFSVFLVFATSVSRGY